MSVFKQLFLAFMPFLFAQMVAAEPASPKREPGTVLVVMSNHSQYPSRSDHTGLWLTELTHVYDALKDAGFGVDFVSPNGGAVPLDERSLGWLYMDAAAKNHLKDPAFMAALESTHAPADIDPAAYQAIFYTGGHGTMWDFKGNQDLKRIAEAIYRNGGIVSSVCHGAAGLLDLQDDNGKPLIQGRRVTGFSNTEESLAGIKEQVPYLLQRELEGRGALYDKGFIPFGSFVMTDGRLVTGQNPGSSKEVAQALLTALRNNKP